jgi:hypothetical protein
LRRGTVSGPSLHLDYAHRSGVEFARTLQRLAHLALSSGHVKNYGTEDRKVVGSDFAYLGTQTNMARRPGRVEMSRACGEPIRQRALLGTASTGGPPKLLAMDTRRPPCMESKDQRPAERR